MSNLEYREVSAVRAALKMMYQNSYDGQYADALAALDAAPRVSCDCQPHSDRSIPIEPSPYGLIGKATELEAEAARLRREAAASLWPDAAPTACGGEAT